MIMTMQYCPDIILNKIYWYLWRYRQRTLCIEYHKYFTYNDYDDFLWYQNKSTMDIKYP